MRSSYKKSSDHARSIINFYKGVINLSFDDLDIDIILKNKSGESYEADTSIFVAVYGVSGTHNDVEISIWDRVYYVENKIVHFEAPIDLNNNGISGLGEGSEDGDAVTVKQLNEAIKNLDDKMKTLESNIYFFTNKPVYNNYTETTVYKTFKFNSLTSYESSGNDYFVLNSDGITIKKSGVYHFYYEDVIIPIMRGNNTSGYLEAQNRTDQFRKINYSNLIEEDTQGHVILEFTSYIPANNKIRIIGVDVKRFGLDSSRNHSVVDKGTFLLIKKIH